MVEDTLIKVGLEFEKFRDLKPNEYFNIESIFSDKDWKLGLLTFSNMGYNLTVGVFVAVNPKKGLFYNNRLFAGEITKPDGEVQIKYNLLSQKDYSTLLNSKSVEIEYTSYIFKDC